MSKRLLTRPERRHLTYLRQKVREAGLTLHTRLRRINISASEPLDQLPVEARTYLAELVRCGGYQVQVYIPSADPRQDRQSPFLNSLTKQAA